MSADISEIKSLFACGNNTECEQVAITYVLANDMYGEQGILPVKTQKYYQNVLERYEKSENRLSLSEPSANKWYLNVQGTAVGVEYDSYVNNWAGEWEQVKLLTKLRDVWCPTEKQW